ncbi:MAG: hypothetical protein IT442_04850, partial [Phycisphaeraceae bacterium]|nr:hypothetical protein [Phycisphaeraceae bacterium]
RPMSKNPHHPLVYKTTKAQDVAASVDAALLLQLNRLEKYTSKRGQLGTAISAEAFFETVDHPAEPWVCYMVPDEYLEVMPLSEMTEAEADKAFGLTVPLGVIPLHEEVEAAKLAEAGAAEEPGIVARVLSAVAGLFRRT